MEKNTTFGMGKAGFAGVIRLTLANCLEINSDYMRLGTFSDNTLKYVQAQAIRYYVSTSRRGFEGAFMVKTQGRKQLNA
jgi:hypothetical protein